MFLQFVVMLILLGVGFQLVLAAIGIPVTLMSVFVIRREDETADFHSGRVNQVIVSILFAAMLAAAIRVFLAAAQPSASWLYAITGFVSVLFVMSGNISDKADDVAKSPWMATTRGASEGAALGGLAALVVYWIVYAWPRLLLALPGGATAFDWSVRTAAWIGQFWLVRLAGAFIAIGLLLNYGMMLLLGLGFMVAGVVGGLKRLFRVGASADI